MQHLLSCQLHLQQRLFMALARTPKTDTQNISPGCGCWSSEPSHSYKEQIKGDCRELPRPPWRGIFNTRSKSLRGGSSLCGAGEHHSQVSFLKQSALFIFLLLIENKMKLNPTVCPQQSPKQLHLTGAEDNPWCQLVLGWERSFP